jgi:hypothetical protein
MNNRKVLKFFCVVPKRLMEGKTMIVLISVILGVFGGYQIGYEDGKDKPRTHVEQHELQVHCPQIHTKADRNPPLNCTKE